MRILLIEDHPFQRNILHTQLNRVITAEDSICDAATGLEALDAMKTFQPDLILCDLNMPEMDGIQFLGCIAEKAFKGSVVITSAASLEVINTVERMCQSYRLNILGCLPKPAAIEELSETVELARKHMLSEQRPVTMLTTVEVEAAYNAGWIKPWYQPIVSLKDGEWVASEALLRLEHPEHGVIPPGAFLPQLEEAGLEAPRQSTASGLRWQTATNWRAGAPLSISPQ